MGKKGWHKLVRIGKSRTRLISIPSLVLRDFGFDIEKTLRGKWHVEHEFLILEIKPLKEKLIE